MNSMNDLNASSATLALKNETMSQTPSDQMISDPVILNPIPTPEMAYLPDLMTDLMTTSLDQVEVMDEFGDVALQVAMLTLHLKLLLIKIDDQIERINKLEQTVQSFYVSSDRIVRWNKVKL